MNTHDYIAMEDEFGATNYRPIDLVLVRGEGVWVWDADGNRYLDFHSAHSSVNQGHCHPRILAAMQEQAALLTIASRGFRTDQLPLFCKELSELTHSYVAIPMSSGAEAVESCIKAVRKRGYLCERMPEGKTEVIVCANNFHGRTITIGSFSSEPQYRSGYGPYTPGFVTIPFGDPAALDAAITPYTVAFLVEPIQSEAGVIVPPTGYLRQVRRICSKRHVPLIIDEVQTGLGRTGKLLAEEHDGIKSDVTIIGRSLSGGFYPVSALLNNNEVLSVYQPGDHASTFGGNPLACAVARMALRVLVEEGMIENSARMGERLMAGLRSINSPYVREVRGKGLLVGVELHPEAGGARRFCEGLIGKGLLCKEARDHVIRFAPPLIIGADDVDWALERIDEVMRG